eukprot:653219-Rhodomonas_salina.1
MGVEPAAGLHDETGGVTRVVEAAGAAESTQPELLALHLECLSGARVPGRKFGGGNPDLSAQEEHYGRWLLTAVNLNPRPTTLDPRP